MLRANSPQEVLTKDDLVGWFMNPITKKVRHRIQQKIEETKNRLGDGFTVYMGNSDKTAMCTAKETGRIEGLEFIFNIEGD